MFKKATKEQSKLRLALSGPSGSGKTYTALELAQYLGEKVAVIDTEHGSASKYADRFDFDTAQLTNFHPGQYVQAIKAAEKAGYDVLVIDSLTHAWYAELDLASGNFSNWAKVRSLERALIDAILGCSCHIIATMRTKTEYVMEETTNKKGKATTSPRKVGTAPIQTSGIDYEFDVAGELDLHHCLNISKSRCSELANTTHLNPGQELAETLKDWLNDGEPPKPQLALVYATNRDRFRGICKELKITGGKAIAASYKAAASISFLEDVKCDDLEAAQFQEVIVSLLVNWAVSQDAYESDRDALEVLSDLHQSLGDCPEEELVIAWKGQVEACLKQPQEWSDEPVEQPA